MTVWTFVLRSQPPFEEDQRIEVDGYKGIWPVIATRLGKPDITMQGTIVRTDGYLVKFGGRQRYFQPFYDSDGNRTLACSVEV